jgi:ribosomal protein S12 methylthiotransferase
MKASTAPVPFALVSLGCPKNFVDSEALAGSLPPDRYCLTPHLSEAEVIVVNTCAFLASARAESLEALSRAASWKKKSCRALVAAGCLPQFLGKDAAREMPEADIILGPGEWLSLHRRLSAFLDRAARARPLIRRVPVFPAGEWDRRRLGPSHTFCLKIADGCDNRCAYCLIGRLRGPYRSRSLPVLLAEARRLAGEGGREIVLVAHDTAFYGREKNGRSLLARLIEGLEAIKGIDWIRLLYLHPSHLDGDFLRTLADSPKFCRYLDIPLQHIDDRVLVRMGRKSSRQKIEQLLDLCRSLIPGLALRTTLMTGFPGEGEEEFQSLKEFVRWQRFDHLGVFAFSPEKGTRAASLRPRVPPPLAARRRDELMRLQKRISRAKLKQRIGEEIEALVDGPFPENGAGLVVGRSRFQAPEVDGLTVVEGEGMKPGDLVRARVTAASAYDLYALKL